MNGNLDMDCLRTFASIAELGTFARAADRVGRSLSAVSLQVDRLEAQIGVQLFRKKGRRKILTDEGERMLLHAKQILTANDAAISALGQDAITGPVRLGVVQDLAEQTLVGVLGEFARAHPRARLDVKVERSKMLVASVERGDLDMAITFEAETSLSGEKLAETDMVWVGPRSGGVREQSPLPLVLFDAPCSFRAAGQKALEKAGTDWRIALSSPGLSGLRAGVEAGLGLTVRTRAFISEAGGSLVEIEGLPKLSRARYILYTGPDQLTAAAEHLKDMCRERLRLI
jgi:DNA-binding transcriptional LysR family regulator